MDTFLKRLATGQAASLTIFLLFLGTTFVCELGIMLALAAALPRDMPPLVASLADATILTITLAPLAWWLFVLPARRLTESRSRLLERILSAQEDERRRIAADPHAGRGDSMSRVISVLIADDHALMRAGLRLLLATQADIEVVGECGTHQEVLEMLGLASAAGFPPLAFGCGCLAALR